MKTTRFLSILLTVLMVLSMLTVGVSAYTVPDGYKIAETPGMNEAGIDGEVYGLIGDADFNDKVNVKDATTIQKYAASLINLDEIAKVLGDVNFDTKVNVIDATTIQKWVAGMEVDSPINHIIYVPTVETTPTVTESTPAESESTPAESESTPAETESTPAETESTPAETESTPAESESTPAESESTPAETESTPAETESTPAESDTIPAEDTITVYFTDARGWGAAYIYAFNGVEGESSDSEPFGVYPGQEMTYVETNSYGQDIYSYEITETVDYIKFSNGSVDGTNRRTDNVPKEQVADNAGFYPADEYSTNKWTVGTYTYEPEVPETSDTTPAETESTPAETESTPAETESTPAESESTSDETTPAETETTPAEDTITVYFTDARGWGAAYIYAFNGVQGESSDSEPFGVYPGQEMTYVKTNSYGQDIYSYEITETVDYIKFSNGSVDGTNRRTDNVPKEQVADNAGFYPADEYSTNKWTVGTYTYEPEVPETSDTTPADTESTPAETESTPAETESTPAETESTPAETEPAADTVTVYFTNNWAFVDQYVYYWGTDADPTWPGVQMTYVRQNSSDQAIYSAEIPADVDGIIFNGIHDQDPNVRRQTVDIKEGIVDNAGFYCDSEVDGKITVGTYIYEDVTPTESTPAETESTPAETESTPAETESTPAETESTPAETESTPAETESTPAETESTPAETESTPAETESTPAETESTPAETESTPADDTITIYFSNNKYWAAVYIYAFYGIEDVETTGTPFGEYPGVEMNYVETNSFGQDIYSYEVPADIDYIKFSDGGFNNDRTANIPNSMLEDSVGFYLNGEGSNGKWALADVLTYTYEAPETPSETESTPAETESTPAETESTPAETETTPAETEPEVETYTVKFVNGAKWAEVRAYAWNDSATWPGVPMTKTGEKVNGFDVYEVTFDVAYQNIIFNNNNNGSQTSDLKFENGKVYDIKSAKWYDTIDDIPAVAATATDRYLVGSFNNWNTTALEFKLNAEGDSTAYAEIELKANTTYEFKVVREGAWTSYNGTITGSATGLQFSSSVGNNAKITTKAAGTYVFAFGMNDSKLSVTYPG